MSGPSRRPRTRRFPWICVAALATGVLLVELGFRWMLFGGETAARMGAGFRHAIFYADPQSDEDFWKLFLDLDRIQPPMPPEAYHPELGWVSEDLDAQTLEHRGRSQVRGRRPVLLYGDSYARCMGKRQDCFEGLMESSDLAARYVILNHGMQAYGLDQIWLILERTIDRYQDERPVVAVAIQVDDCLDRTVLRIRGWPKPRLRVAGDALEPEVVPVPTTEGFLAENPIRIRSYAWRYLLNGTAVLPSDLVVRLRGDAAVIEEKKALSRRILQAIVDSLDRRGCEYFFVLFYGEDYTSGARPPDWREELLRDFFRERKVPFTSAGRALRDASRLSGRPVVRYFGHRGEERDHLLADGNRAAFRALRDGIEHRFEVQGGAPQEAQDFESSRLPDGRPAAIFERGTSELFPRIEDAERLRVEVRGGAPSVVRYALTRRCSAFEGIVRMVSEPECASATNRVRVLVEADGNLVSDAVLARGDPPLPLRIDLSGRESLTITFQDGGDGDACDRVFVASPRFR